MNRVTVPDVVDDFRRYHQVNPIWGSLHIILSDHNVRDCDVEFCVEWAAERGDAEGERLARILSSMTRTQRLKISKLA